MVDVGEYLDKGFFHARVIIEVVGAPKEHVDNTLQLFTHKIKQDEERYIITKEDFEEAEKDGEEKFFTGFAELEILMKDFRALFEFCLDYMPSSIEIMEPEAFKFTANDYNVFINELLAKLHQINGVAKNLKAKNELLEMNAVNLLRNNVVICLKNQELSLEDLAKASGTKPDQLQNFLKVWIEEGHIVEENNTYKLPK
jgi:hypothetical protein